MLHMPHNMLTSVSADAGPANKSGTKNVRYSSCAVILESVRMQDLTVAKQYVIMQSLAHNAVGKFQSSLTTSLVVNHTIASPSSRLFSMGSVE